MGPWKSDPPVVGVGSAGDHGSRITDLGGHEVAIDLRGGIGQLDECHRELGLGHVEPDAWRRVNVAGVLTSLSRLRQNRAILLHLLLDMTTRDGRPSTPSGMSITHRRLRRPFRHSRSAASREGNRRRLRRTSRRQESSHDGFAGAHQAASGRQGSGVRLRHRCSALYGSGAGHPSLPGLVVPAAGNHGRSPGRQPSTGPVAWPHGRTTRWAPGSRLARHR